MTRTRHRRLRRALPVVGLSFAALLIAAAVFIVMASPRERTSSLSLQTQLRNFREVDPGRFYRSGQLSGEQFEEAIEELGIRTIINLRGTASNPSEWYVEEVEASQRLGVEHIDVRLSARSVPRARELIRLLDAYRDAPRPILVHCEDGADRAGEASAIYQIEYMGMTRDEALRMLTMPFLHFELFRPAKRYFVERYQGEQWARTDYEPCDYAYFDKQKYCGAPPEEP